MRLWSSTLVAGLLVATALAVADDPKLPPLPKDTLPKQIAIDTIPLGLEPARAVPDDNPLTEAKVQLGRRLFFDPILSADGSIACASCHDPAHSFAQSAPLAIGIGGKRGTRNAPSLLNRAYGKSMFWDGRTASLEEQALKPIESPHELGSTVRDAVARIAAKPDYRRAFDAAFPDGATAANLAKAIACFERTLLLGNTKIDRFVFGEVAAVDELERRGLWVFESRGRCWRCHSGRNFSDEQTHNTGVAWFVKPERPVASGSDPIDLGRHAVTKQDADRGRFKTPTLRGVARSAPYMHDGSFATLEDVIDFYNRGGGKNPHLDRAIEPLDLPADDIRALIAFLKALSE